VILGKIHICKGGKISKVILKLEAGFFSSVKGKHLAEMNLKNQPNQNSLSSLQFHQKFFRLLVHNTVESCQSGCH
jgi:hypothetical protein